MKTTQMSGGKTSTNIFRTFPDGYSTWSGKSFPPWQTANQDCAGHAEWIYELFWVCYTNAYSFSKCLYVWVNLVWGLVLLKWEWDYRRMVNTPSFNFISSFAMNLRGIKLALVCPQQRKTLSGFIGGKWGLIACPNETPCFSLNCLLD